ncbi:hypothetical protein BVRB_5g126310 [Beta vulgaris subsp. vulgaris]|uniref:Uncharacterized protein n=1 Tax=Beta vulgaris subsp. vulgaris TaxID=3555 RepID=A0A0J8BBX8_BETVV|nr:hypothetical protein BVRB_5g126310 [Beta vulgaris subsp. vulgaris]
MGNKSIRYPEWKQHSSCSFYPGNTAPNRYGGTTNATQAHRGDVRRKTG